MNGAEEWNRRQRKLETRRRGGMEEGTMEERKREERRIGK
jgi:hypothetical protein